MHYFKCYKCKIIYFCNHNCLYGSYDCICKWCYELKYGREPNVSCNEKEVPLELCELIEVIEEL